MFLGRVIGNVVCTIRRSRQGSIVQPLDRRGRDKGRPLVALDSVGAGAGETIYWCRGREATLAFRSARMPTEATIVGIVDQVNIPGIRFGTLPS